MSSYILKRLFLMIPTLIGIILLNFLIVQIAPGGPVQQILLRMRGDAGDIDSRFGGGGDAFGQDTMGSESGYQGAHGIDPKFIKELEKQFGFDQPIHKRFFKMMKDYLRLDLGKSYFRDTPVIDLIQEKMKVSISLGLWTTLFVYLISIPLGIKKATCDGSPFDVWSSTIVIISYAIPSFLFALFLITFFSGGSFLKIFPLRGVTSEAFDTMTLLQKIGDYAWHMALPIFAMVMGGFAKLTLLTKNSFLEEMSKQYVVTARAKGASQRIVLYRHVFKNAMLLVIAGFPAAFVHIFFTSSLLIEVLFSLDGLGLLGFESAMNRDFPVMFGFLFVYTLIGMVMQLISDVMYGVIDKRIHVSLSK